MILQPLVKLQYKVYIICISQVGGLVSCSYKEWRVFQLSGLPGNHNWSRSKPAITDQRRPV